MKDEEERGKRNTEQPTFEKKNKQQRNKNCTEQNKKDQISLVSGKFRTIFPKTFFLS